MLGKIVGNNCKQIKNNKICYSLFTMNIKINLFGSRDRGDYNEHSDWISF